jgi:hypothetical protein
MKFFLRTLFAAALIAQVNAQCESQDAALGTCLENDDFSSAAESACELCLGTNVVDATLNITSCGDVASMACSSIANCECGSACNDEILAYVTCEINDYRSGTDCTFSCTSSPTAATDTAAPSSAAATGTTPPSPTAATGTTPPSPTTATGMPAPTSSAPTTMPATGGLTAAIGLAAAAYFLFSNII